MDPVVLPARVPAANVQNPCSGYIVATEQAQHGLDLISNPNSYQVLKEMEEHGRKDIN